MVTAGHNNQAFNPRILSGIYHETQSSVLATSIVRYNSRNDNPLSKKICHPGLIRENSRQNVRYDRGESFPHPSALSLAMIAML
jgi:hypothetical protein